MNKERGFGVLGKRLLKLALRGFKFRVVEVHPADNSGTITLTEDSDE